MSSHFLHIKIIRNIILNKNNISKVPEEVNKKDISNNRQTITFDDYSKSLSYYLRDLYLREISIKY